MQTHSEITIRTLRGEEREQLRVLSERDSAEVPTGTVLGAFTGGRLVAATSIDGGTTVADPFRTTAQARSLVTRRAQQLRGEGGRGGGLRRLFERRTPETAAATGC